MGKKKTKGPMPPQMDQIHNRPQEPTAMELAFRKAEEQNRQESPATPQKGAVSKQPPEHFTISSKSGEMKKMAVAEPLPAKDVPATSTKKKKRIYIPPPPPVKQQVSTVGKPARSSQDSPSRSAATPVASGKTKPASLGLKSLPSKVVVLDIDAGKAGKTSGTAGEHQMVTSKIGRFQVHTGTYTDERDIVIGFDFGTSSSKIVIRDFGTRNAYAVPFFKAASGENPYLLPTRIFINDDGTCDLWSGEQEYADLKINLLDDPGKTVYEAENLPEAISVSELSVIYLALAIRHSRSWFLEHTTMIYKKKKINWWINLGIPSRNYDDQNIRDNFRAIAMAAWSISGFDGQISIISAKKHLPCARKLIACPAEWRDEHEPTWLHPDFVNTHPEVIMEIVGYARSPLRTNGLYLLIDVGATTLDAATFIIHEQAGEDIFPVLETNVERFGTMMLHRCRIQALKKYLEENLQEISSHDPIKPLPDLSRYQVNIVPETLQQAADVIFFQNCAKVVGKVIRETWLRRDPNARAWARGLPVFVCGGGARLKSYRNMIIELGGLIRKFVVDIEHFDIKNIPKPNEVDAPELAPGEYDRLAVAYGLSFSVDEIGEIIPQSRIEDLPRNTRTLNTDDRYISKDMC